MSDPCVFAVLAPSFEILSPGLPTTLGDGARYVRQVGRRYVGLQACHSYRLTITFSGNSDLL